ncbi:hypothetical protein COEREDRAFT_7687 [Coemansia reversa NRRL 1564]|uniref:Uncharacterized protein n=1 Tax=Coemansia reversa (strain ATCC 12441 / NRRL 1564) TaxID=763665 RepID=A0A2G5BEB7_COERN|nr:hypothetical protein COEREDRAFT_7687 [Coemansia reversa NRRL 1564]|eukprot:PIA17341.1 hypothetical protein COEREDRAFT_7687 [Coemansia reversa NRRL 1564]
MALQKSFLDVNSGDMTWMSGTQMSCLQSTNNSQNETLFDSQSQTFGVMDMPLVRPPQLGVTLDDNRRLHQDHKILKRAVDKGNQESAASISSLHEKASKINLSVSDLHSDLKKLERMVTHNSASPQTSIVDMEAPWMYPAQDGSCVLDQQRNAVCSTTSRLSGMDPALGEAMSNSQSIAFKHSAAGRCTKCTMSFSMANAMQHVESQCSQTSAVFQSVLDEGPKTKRPRM